MQKWEYLFVHSDDPWVKMVNDEEIQDKLKVYDFANKLGKEGWELAGYRHCNGPFHEEVLCSNVPSHLARMKHKVKFVHRHRSWCDFGTPYSN